MKTSFRKSFERDLKKLKKDHEMLRRIRETISEIEDASDFEKVSSISKLTGGSGAYYRIRVGRYRIGVELVDDVVVFTRCLHRRDIYRYFP